MAEEPWEPLQMEGRKTKRDKSIRGTAVAHTGESVLTYQDRQGSVRDDQGPSAREGVVPIEDSTGSFPAADFRPRGSTRPSRAAVDNQFRPPAIEVAETVKKKNAIYGNSFEKAGEVLKILYPHGIQLEQYQDVLTVVRILDKFFRIATDKDALGENPWEDICGYSLLAVERGNRK